jgi:hypothetical protein
VILHGGQRAKVNPIETSISSITLPTETLATPKPIVDLASLPRIIADAVAAIEVRVIKHKNLLFMGAMPSTALDLSHCGETSKRARNNHLPE